MPELPQDHLSALYNQVSDVRVTCTKHEEQLANITNKLFQIESKLDKDLAEHRKAIYGNGGPGIMTAVALHDERTQRLSKRMTWLLGLVGAIAVALGIDKLGG